MKQDRTEEYRSTLKEKLERIVFDRSSGESYSFEDLFYPIEIGEGKYAFQSYVEQMEMAHRLSEPSLDLHKDNFQFEAKILELKKQIGARNETIEEPKAGPGVSKDILERADGGKDDKDKENMFLSHRAEKEERDFNRLLHSVQAKIRKQTEDNGTKPENSKADTVEESVEENCVDEEYENDVPPTVLSEENGKSLLGSSILEMIKDFQNEQKERIDRTADYLAHSISDTQMPRENLLETETKYWRSSLIISENARESRILAVASAGHGKTTLLRRIALFYCHPFNNGDRHTEVRDKYELSGDYIPCLIWLRDSADGSEPLSKIIDRNICAILNNNDTAVQGDEETSEWIDEVRDNLLLLIDGLDELSDSGRIRFLHVLDDYLDTYPRTHVIMTSRVAGLSDPSIKEILRKMRFRGRSILPLTDEEAKKYAARWVEVTQPEDQQGQLLYSIDQILNQQKFHYLKEFMRTPLELMLILKQIATDSFSLNRYQMFRDTLWEFFTNHVKRFDQKRIVFEDTMTFLGFIAYQMQMNDSLYISVSELEALSGELSHLSFQSSFIGKGKTEDCTRVLDALAANIGIIEKDDRTSDVVYTFPIRAYQEFLVAHACCHLRLDPKLSRPDAIGIIQQHLSDSRWSNIICFALSDLGTNNQREFDSTIEYIFDVCHDMELFRRIVEADLSITKSHAVVLCKKVFSEQFLGESQKELLTTCMGSKSASAYALALNTLYQASPSGNQYLEANAISAVMWEYIAYRSAFSKAESLLRTASFSHIALGAEMISVMVRTYLDEAPEAVRDIEVANSYRDRIKSDFSVSDELMTLLADKARSAGCVICVIALTDIWLSRIEGSEGAKGMLDEGLARLIISEMDKNSGDILTLCLEHKDVLNSQEFRRIRELASSLGAFPVTKRTARLPKHGREDPVISLLLHVMYRKSAFEAKYDQIAMATACMFYCWSLEKYMNAWVYDICRGLPSQYVRKGSSSIREVNDFFLKRKDLEKPEQTFREAQMQKLNEYPSVFSLFRAGKVLEAAKFCVRTMGESVMASKTNLAFLMRYGHLNNEDIGVKGETTIPELLSEGVLLKDDYALMNLALFRLEERDYSFALSLFSQISREGWERTSHSFWYPELWERSRDPEGALVCVLAHKYGGCDFDDYEDMVCSVNHHYQEGIESIIHE